MLTEVILFIAIFVLVVAFRSRKNLRLCENGKYDEFIALYRKKAARGLGEAHRNSCLFNVAAALHRKGDMAAAQKTLEEVEIKGLPTLLRPFYYELRGRTLLFLEGSDPKLIRECYETACSDENVRAHPVLLLSKGHFEATQGNIQTARRILEEFLSNGKAQPRIKWGWTLLFFDSFVRIMEQYCIGYIYWRTGEIQKARLHLESAIKCPYTNFYSTKAQELLGKLQS